MKKSEGKRKKKEGKDGNFNSLTALKMEREKSYLWFKTFLKKEEVRSQKSEGKDYNFNSLTAVRMGK
ncbi:MAG: hypothetical protein WBA93_08125 [Microcoleaceae cyanobacterium]